MWVNTIKRNIMFLNRVLLTQLCIYIVLFILLPNITFLQGIDIIWISLALIITTIIYVFAIIKLVPNVLYWTLGIPFFWLLIMIYHPTDIYGISDSKMGLDLTSASIDALLFSLLLFVEQIIIKIIYIVIKKHNKY